MTNTSPSSSLGSQIRVLTTRLMPYLRHLEHRYSLNPADSADLVQEALIRYSIHRAKIRNPLSWLVCVLRRGCLRLLRVRRPDLISLETLSEQESAQIAEAPSATLENRMRLEKVVAGLSPRHQRVLRMRFVAGMKWREIAATLGCQTAGAKKAVSRALSAARTSAASF